MKFPTNVSFRCCFYACGNDDHSEKALSDLKIIQNYTKNSIGQTKLNDLIIGDIEEKDAAKMDIKGITSDFCKSKEEE